METQTLEGAREKKQGIPLDCMYYYTQCCFMWQKTNTSMLFYMHLELTESYKADLYNFF